EGLGFVEVDAGEGEGVGEGVVVVDVRGVAGENLFKEDDGLGVPRVVAHALAEDPVVVEAVGRRGAEPGEDAEDGDGDGEQGSAEEGTGYEPGGTEEEADGETAEVTGLGDPGDHEAEAEAEQDDEAEAG